MDRYEEPTEDEISFAAETLKLTFLVIINFITEMLRDMKRRFLVVTSNMATTYRSIGLLSSIACKIYLMGRVK